MTVVVKVSEPPRVGVLLEVVVIALGAAATTVLVLKDGVVATAL